MRTFSRNPLEIINKILKETNSGDVEEQSELVSGEITDERKRLNLQKESLEKVLNGCEAIKSLHDRSKKEILGHDAGFSLVWILQKFPNWREVVSQMKGWGKEKSHLEELEHSYDKGYIGYSCKEMIARGLCTKTQVCDPRGGLIGGQKVGPHPLLLALKDVEDREIDIDVTSTVPINGRISQIVNSLLVKEGFYLYGNRLSKVTKKGLQVAIHRKDLLVLLSSCFSFVTFQTNAKGEVSVRHSTPSDDFLIILQDRLTTSPLKEIKYFADYPVLQRNKDLSFGLCNYGFNPASNIYVHGFPLKSRRTRKYLDKALVDFCFRTEIDRINFIGFLLTGLIHHLLPGRVPSLQIEGNQRNLGKTLLAMVLGIIVQGSDAYVLPLSDNDEDIEKRLASVIKLGGRVVIFDNLKAGRSLRAIGGPLLERIITAPILQFRLLGGNDVLSAPNNLLTIVTTNGIDATDDYISRRVAVELYASGNPIGRNFQNKDLLFYIQENLNEIRAEILGMGEVWIEMGCPMGKAKHRCHSWAGPIDGILEANGLIGFLSNQKDFEQSSGIVREFEKCLEWIPKDVTLNAKQILERCRPKNNYFTAFDSVSTFSKKILVPLIGQEFSSESGEKFVFESAGKSSEKSALFSMNSLKKAKRPEKQDVDNLLLLTKKVNEVRDLFGVPEEGVNNL